MVNYKDLSKRVVILENIVKNLIDSQSNHYICKNCGSVIKLHWKYCQECSVTLAAVQNKKL